MAGLMVQPADAHEVVQMLGTGHQQHQRDQKQHRCFISSDAFVDDARRNVGLVERRAISRSGVSMSVSVRRVAADGACRLWRKLS